MLAIALTTPRLTIRAVRAGDAAELLAYYQRNGARLKPWEPDRPAAFYSFEYWERFAAGANDESQSRLRLLAFEPASNAVVASVNLQSIERGAIHRAVLGYSVDGAFEGKGIAREAVGAIVRFAFDSLHLHRVEANYQPANERSGKLLRSLDFVVEGYARDYLYLDGAWRDHVLTSRTNPDY